MGPGPRSALSFSPIPMFFFLQPGPSPPRFGAIDPQDEFAGIGNVFFLSLSESCCQKISAPDFPDLENWSVALVRSFYLVV